MQADPMFREPLEVRQTTNDFHLRENMIYFVLLLASRPPSKKKEKTVSFSFPVSFGTKPEVPRPPQKPSPPANHPSPDPSEVRASLAAATASNAAMSAAIAAVEGNRQVIQARSGGREQSWERLFWEGVVLIGLSTCEAFFPFFVEGGGGGGGGIWFHEFGHFLASPLRK